METKDLDLKTLKHVKSIFDLHSNHSASTHGYHSLCKLIEEVSELRKTQSTDGKLPIQLISNSLPDKHQDTEADGIVFCGKCGKMK